MPHLSVFTVCDKVIIDQDSVVSLIALFGKITMAIPQDVPEVPRNAVTPKEWAIFSRWDWQPDDEGRAFYQHLEVRWPDGNLFWQGTNEIIRAVDRIHTQLNMPFIGIPIGIEGTVTAHLSLESEGATLFTARPLSIEIAHSRIPRQ